MNRWTIVFALHGSAGMAYDDRDDEDSDVNIRRPTGEVPNYLVPAILVTLCCCLPFGIAAIINASQVNTHLARGDYEQAVAASERAHKWCWVAAILGIIANGLYLALQLANAGGGLR